MSQPTPRSSTCSVSTLWAVESRRTASACLASAFASVTAVCVFGLGTPALAQTDNDPKIKFDWPIKYPLAPCESVAAADITGDGRLDVVTSVYGDAIQIYANKGDGVLELLKDIPLPLDTAGNAQCADIDNDGDPDISWFHRVGFEFALNVYYMEGHDGSGRLYTVPLENFASTHMWEDLDRDGDLDCVLWEYNRLRSLRNDGVGQFIETGQYEYWDDTFDLQAVTLGDVDGDGDNDIAAIFCYTGYYSKQVSDSSLVLLFNDGRGGFARHREYSLPLGYGEASRHLPRDMKFGDFDGDADLDIAFVGDYGQSYGDQAEILLLSQEPTGFELKSQSLYGDGSANRVELADCDADGDLDVLMITEFVNGVYVYQNLGNWTFDLLTPYPTDAFRPDALCVADITSDGLVDVLSDGASCFTMVTNITHVPEYSLQQTPLVRGEVATFRTGGLEAGDRVWFYGSPYADRYTRGILPLGGMVLDVDEAQAFLFGSAVADENGVATLRVRIPQSVYWNTVVTQAAVQRVRPEAKPVKSRFNIVPVQ